MIDLKSIIEKYPECLESPEKFKGFMLDLYPDLGDRARIKVLTDAFSSGLVDEIRNGEYKSVDISRYIHTMEAQYGYSLRLISESIKQWINAFNSTENPSFEKEEATKLEKPILRGAFHTHKYNDIVVPATCQEGGYTVHRCNCGYEYKDSFTFAEEHTYEVVDKVEATCTQEGRIDYLCSSCSDYKYEVLPIAKHSFGAWNTKLAAKCMKEGIEVRYCKVCKKEETRPLSSIGHNWKWAEQVHPSCENDGIAIGECKNCGGIQEKAIPAIGHKWSKWRVQRKATSEANGIKVRLCQNCGKVEEKEIIFIDFNPSVFSISNEGRLTKYKGNDSIVIIPDGVTSISHSAFEWCKSLTSITIPESVTSIGNLAFKDCRNLTSITIPENVTSIGYEAFFNCESLTSITIPESVTSIGYGAFECCRSLINITIPDSVKRIGDVAFFGCKGLCDKEGLVIIHNVLHYYDMNKIDHIVRIPNGVTSIGNSAFILCGHLTNITIPNSVISIGDSAFEGCISLESITIPHSVKSIGERAFRGCYNLRSITIPDSVISIGEGLFFDCYNLEEIIVVEGSYAEMYCIKNGLDYKYYK